MGRSVLRLALGCAILISVSAVFSMLVNGLHGHAMIWSVITICTLSEWRRA